MKLMDHFLMEVVLSTNIQKDFIAELFEVFKFCNKVPKCNEYKDNLIEAVCENATEKIEKMFENSGMDKIYALGLYAYKIKGGYGEEFEKWYKEEYKDS